MTDNKQVLEFLSDVQEYGQPVWEKHQDGPTVTVDGKEIELVDSQYGKSLQIHTPSGVKYVPLKQGVPEKDTYTLVMFKATRDWADYNIVAGSISPFAV